MEPPLKKVYQRPLLFSKQLPYSDKLEAEANEMFEKIKKNLSFAVQRRELWPGVMYWTMRLQRYYILELIRIGKFVMSMEHNIMYFECF